MAVRRRVHLLLVLSSVILLQGCTRTALRVISQMTAAGEPAYARETDLELAEHALAANIKLIEALLETDPHNATLLLQVVQALGGYTYAFVEARIEAARDVDRQQVSQQIQRAQHLYDRGVQYGLRLLSHYHPDWQLAAMPEGPPLDAPLRQLDQGAIPALFWTSFCWGGALNMARTTLETVAVLPRFQAVLRRLLDLDATYFYGLPHLLQAVQYAGFSPLLGGNPDKAQFHFMQAEKLSQGRLLIVPLLEAQYYAVQTQNRSLFQARLQQILNASEALFPEQGFLNAVAKQRAALLLQRIDALFF